MQLSAIFRYPLKSARGIALSEATVRPRGLSADRRWMLVDEQGRFVTGRILPALVLLQVLSDASGALELSWPGADSHREPVPAGDGQRTTVRVWSDQVEALLGSTAAAAWLSNRFGRALRLVYMDAEALRMTSDQRGHPAQPVSFADGYPLLLCNDASLGALSEALGRPLEMARFRPNLVVSGAAAWAEDQWRVLKIGGLHFRVANPCTRCVFTTVDPERGMRDEDGEPLGILKRLRQRDEGVIFGVNLLPMIDAESPQRSLGKLRQGDCISVLE